MGLQLPPLREIHADSGATFTEFGGWDMPVEFDSIRTEHVAVREDVGIFDVSHMGEIRVSGPDATALMQRLTTRDVTGLSVWDAAYSTITDENGHIIDDTIVYRLPDEDGTETFLFVPNAGHDEQMHDRWVSHRDEWELDATVENVTQEYAMVALQGPNAVEHGASVADDAIDDLRRYTACETTIDGVDVIAARIGYTGEDGFEFMIPWDEAETVWQVLDATPCGLGARDTLRLEAGYPLSGNEFDIESNPRTPLEAGLGFVVDLETEFVGKDALVSQQESGLEEQLVGFELTDRGVPRHGYDIATGEEVIGTVTSGTMSPTLGTPIGMGYVSTAYADPDTDISVIVRDRPKAARVKSLPFIETIETKQ